jgi:DnaJ-domain-containing protein 1
MGALQRLAAPVAAWCLMAPFAALALAAGLQPEQPEAPAPSAIEQALIEHRCAASRTALDTSHQDCMAAQLLAIRADFGADLNKLSRSERRAIDAACSKTPAVQDRDAYVACLDAQLTTVRERWARARPAPPPDTAAQTAPTADPSASAAAAAPLPGAAAPGSHLAAWMWVAGGLVVLLAGAGGVLAARKKSAAPPTCKVCGEPLSGAGDMCQKCRHDAAEEKRRAAGERADQERAQAEEQRLQAGQEAELRAQAAQQEADALRQEEERAREAQRERDEQDARLREEEALQRQQIGVPPQEETDPYAILGVAPGVSQEALLAAYEQAKSKYDPDLVSHLGDELQQHFKAKAQAVEQAYLRLKE